MNEGNIDLFVQPSMLAAVLADQEAILRFGEFRRKQFDPAITGRLALFQRHDLIACKSQALFLKSCSKYVGEVVRQTLAGMCTSKARTNVGYEAFHIWIGKLCDELKACLDREDADRERTRSTGSQLPPFKELRRAMLQNLLEPPAAGNEVDEFYSEFCRTLKVRLDTELLWLAESLAGYPALKYGDFCDWLVEPAKDLTLLKETVIAHEERENEHRAASWRVERKILVALQRLVDPIARRVEEVIAEDNTSFITWMMMKLYTRLHSHFAPKLFPPNRQFESLDYGYFGTQIILQFLFQAESYDAKALASGIEKLIEAPRLFARWPCSPEKQRVKTFLRHFTELAAGPVEYPVERDHLLTRLRTGDACHEEILCLASEYLGALCAAKVVPARLKQFLDPLVTRWIDDLPGWMRQIKISESRYRLRRTDDIEFEKLLAEESAMSEEMTRLQSAWSHYRPEPPQEKNEPSLEPISETIALSYVENLGSELWRTQKIECPREDLAVTLDFHLLDTAVETVVPVSSIARAIEHYLYEMEPEQRLLLPMERIAGENWRKLKRGGQRIYILKKEGEIFVHLMKRKDWAIASAQEARF